MATPLRNIRVSDDDWADWQDQAKAAGLSVTALIHRRMHDPVPARQTRTEKIATLDQQKAERRAASTSDCPHPRGARVTVNASLGLHRCGACGDTLRR